MVQLLEDLPPYVVGLRGTGEITKEDYEKTILPAVEKASKEFGRFNFLFLLETDIQNFTVAAWMHDAYMSFKKWNNWNRVATVSDQKIADKLTDLLRFGFPGDSKGFTIAELEQAKQWVSEPPSK